MCRLYQTWKLSVTVVSSALPGASHPRGDHATLLIPILLLASRLVRAEYRARVRMKADVYEALVPVSFGYASTSIKEQLGSGIAVEPRGPHMLSGLITITPAPTATASKLSWDHCSEAGYSGRPRVSRVGAGPSLILAECQLDRCHRS